MTPKEQRIYRAAEADRLLHEPLLVEALDAIEKQAIDEILTAPFWQDRKRRHATERARVIRDIRRRLRAAITDGMQASRMAPPVA